MNFDKDTYTKEEVEQLLKELNDLVVSGNQAIEELQAEKKANAIKYELLKNGLDESMFDLVDAETVEKAQEKIKKLVELTKKQKLDNSFKPEDKKKASDEYSHAEKSGDVEKMVKTKISKLFE